MVANPERPLSVAFAGDLAAALARSGHPVRVVAPFKAPFPESESIVWIAGGEPDELCRAARETPPGSSLLVIQSAAKMAPWLEQVPGDRVAGVDALLLPVEAAEWGIEEARATLREVADAAGSLRIAVLILSAPGPDAVASLFGRLAASARGEFGLELELAGKFERDRASFRALLRGIPLVDLDPRAASARSLARLVGGLVPEVEQATASTHPSP